MSKVPRPEYAFVRMRHPTVRGLYYSSTKGEFVRQGWTKWERDEWEMKFAGDVERHWEFFGYVIPLFTDDDEQQ